MELNVEKIKQIKKAMGLTYQDLADRLEMKHRQQVFDLLKNKRIMAAEKFAEIFGIDAKDLIK